MTRYSLRWLSILQSDCTRPDLAQVLSVVSRYMANPGKEHWSAVKWILRYLKGTKSLGVGLYRC